jgi:hypothetical protein
LYTCNALQFHSRKLNRKKNRLTIRGHARLKRHKAYIRIKLCYVGWREHMESLKSKIKKRLERYLELDVSGIRSCVLKILLSLKTFTVDKLHKTLSKKFKVSWSAVASMVGYIHSKLGILRAHKDSYKTPTVYYLKEEYVDLVHSVLSRTQVVPHT